MLFVGALAVYDPLPFPKFRDLAQRFLNTKYPAQPLFPPLAFYGDFHGSGKAILAARANKMPKVLLGDYVDRGAAGVFVLQTAMAMQVRGEAFLLRGNHEDLEVNARYNFISQLYAAYPDDFDEAKEIVRRVYAHMPLMLLVNSAFGAVAAMHGGVSFHQRALEIIDFAPCTESLEDILWSDPAAEFGPSPRGMGLTYDHQHFLDWSARNGISAVVRGHEVVLEGVRDDFGDRRHWTVFSAAGYEGSQISGGWLQLDDETGFMKMIL